jgi:4a-hydroxytetrahydrobiopterin dehydratase
MRWAIAIMVDWRPNGSTMKSSPFGLELADLGWSVEASGRVAQKHFCFGDFTTAFAFMAWIAKVAQRLDHHPDWRNVYGDVWITLTTHDTGGLTHLDVALARACDKAVAQFKKE